MKRHEFRILGPLEVRSGDGLLELGGRRQRTLLAFLLLNGNSVVSSERIVDAVWGEHPPATARNALQVGVHGIRKALGSERVITQGAGYRLALEPDELDLERFLALGERAREEPLEDAAATLREALAFHRGTCPRGPRRASIRRRRAQARRGASAGGARAADRRRPGSRSRGRARRRAARPRRRAPVPRAAAGAADARPLPIGQAGRRARAVPGRSVDLRRGTRPRSIARAGRAPGGHAEAGREPGAAGRRALRFEPPGAAPPARRT